LLCDNEGIVIGGLIQETDSDTRQGIARLSDLNFIGGLFRRKETTKNRKEIIMALVPRLVPYYPVYDQYANDKFHQSNTPLFEGPLDRTFRPWEPRLREHQLIPHGYSGDSPHNHEILPPTADNYIPTTDPQNDSPAGAGERIIDGTQNQNPPKPVRAPEPLPPQKRDSTDETEMPVETLESTRRPKPLDADVQDPPPVFISRLPSVTAPSDLSASRIIRRLPPIDTKQTPAKVIARNGPARVIGLR
jgi:hypothetical protein